MTADPSASGARNASRQKRNDIRTSVSQFAANSFQESSCSGDVAGVAPPQMTSTSGRRVVNTCRGASSVVASRVSVRTPGSSLAKRSSASRPRATARTSAAPCSRTRWTISRPTPRLAPRTTTLLPLNVLSLMVHLCPLTDSCPAVLPTRDTRRVSNSSASGKKPMRGQMACVGRMRLFQLLVPLVAAITWHRESFRSP